MNKEELSIFIDLSGRSVQNFTEMLGLISEKEKERLSEIVLLLATLTAEIWVKNRGQS